MICISVYVVQSSNKRLWTKPLTTNRKKSKICWQHCIWIKPNDAYMLAKNPMQHSQSFTNGSHRVHNIIKFHNMPIVLFLNAYDEDISLKSTLQA